jgi:hypothetical protein
LLLSKYTLPPYECQAQKQLAIRTGVTYDESMPRKKLPPEILDFFRKQGAKGGKKGGTARAANMTAEQRSESARRAVQARWAKVQSSP